MPCFLLLAMALLLALPAAAGAPVSGGCDTCHAKPDLKRVLDSGRVQSLHVSAELLDASVHAGKQCIQCHSDVVESPHTEAPRPVNCVQCHYQGNTVGAPESDDLYRKYRDSAHGRAAAAGNAEAPACQDCHGGHDIQKVDSPQARVARERVSTTCGGCHLDIYAEYRRSVHGIGLDEGGDDVPSCTGCHTEHGILPADEPQSSTHVTHIAATCASCHAAATIVGKYGISSGQVDTYEESFHGVAIQYGMRTVANCASCHGVHDIRPQEDPASSVNIANIPQTCGKCHPGANANYARGKMHIEAQSPEAGIVYYVASFFKWLTIATVSVLVLHLTLDFYRQIRGRKSAR